jgi:2-dehydro-3-deoxy-D-gluconate 5-dehydrogenase
VILRPLATERGIAPPLIITECELKLVVDRSHRFSKESGMSEPPARPTTDDEMPGSAPPPEGGRSTSADLFALAERRIVVTGAGRGLGRGLATGIAKQGAHVVLVARSLPELGETARKIRDAGGSCRIVPADLANPGELDRLVTDLLADAVPDGIVHAAGVQVRKPATEVTPDDWHRIQAVNVEAPFFLSTGLARAQAGAALPASHVFITSLSSSIAVPNCAPYAASKSSLLGVIRTLSAEWARRGIRVNGIQPGYFRTRLTEDLLSQPDQHERVLGRIPMGRLGTAQDLVGAAVFLLSGASSYVTGQNIAVDGGWLAS